jgi:diguanylate cyclase (GGDEF)-like protein
MPPSHPPRDRRPPLWGLLEMRAPMIWTAALLYLFGGLACMAAVVFPVSSREPVRLDFAVGVVACALALGLWSLGRRLPPAALQAAMVLATLVVSTIVASARTSGGAILTAYAYPWIAVYTAHFFSRRAVVAQTLLISVSFGVALVLGGLPNMGIDWAIVTCTVCSTALVLGRLSESLRQRADTDQLTGLLNRNGFLTAAVREHAIAQRTRTPLTIAVLDLDGFKQVNDRLGHAAGDRLLADLGRVWRERLRAGDILARHGGDEFVLLLPATAPGEADQVLERLGDERLAVEWSVGFSEWLPGEDLDAALARADRSLYRAKRTPRSRPPADAGGSRPQAGAGYRSGSLLPST